MIEQSDKFVMMIEPVRPTTEYVDDALTKLAKVLFSLARSDGAMYRGVHRCVCGAQSDNTNWILPGERVTNSLLVHYVAEHRDEIPQSEIDKLLAVSGSVSRFDYGMYPEVRTRQMLGDRLRGVEIGKAERRAEQLRSGMGSR